MSPLPVKMELDLLRKENEFHKENEKLEQRTKELLQKVNDVMVSECICYF